MTQRRDGRFPERNDFDRLVEGVGLRGSSFMDLDVLVHDGETHRFLGIELKRAGESCNRGEWITLADLALEPRWTVWYVMFMNDGQLAWADLRLPESITPISREGFLERYRCWWQNRYSLDRFVQFDEEVRLRSKRSA